MLRPSRLSRFALYALTVMLILALLAGAVPARADGIRDGIIDNPYGATRSIDGAGNDDPNGDSEVCPIGDGNRGNLMELHAYFAPINPPFGPPFEAWQFAFVVDSSHSLDDTSNDFFGKPANQLVTYILGIDVGCNGGPAGDMNATGFVGPWTRFFSWQGVTFAGGNAGVDYFIGMYPAGPDAMNGMLYSMNGSAKNLLLSSITIETRVVDYRRHIEFFIEDDPWLPSDLKTNGPICLALVSTENTNDRDNNPATLDGGRVIDDLGNGGSVTGCDLRYRLNNTGGNGPMPVKIDTQPNCQASGRPLPGGSATRHCTSLPARQTVNELDSGNLCIGSPVGLNIDGFLDSGYNLLTEARFAGPYQGGDAAASDFGGESSAYSYWDGSAMQFYPGLGNADVRFVHARTDGFFLYTNVSGPGLNAFGGLGQMAGQPTDSANLFIAIDIPTIVSGTDRGDHGGGPEVYTPPNAPAGSDLPNHPGNRPINFRGWDPDYIVEMIWAGDDGTFGAAQLWRWNTVTQAWVLAGTFSTVETTGTSPSGIVPFNTSWHTAGNPPTAGSLYFGRQPGSFEFAIPWIALGVTPGNPHPLARENIRMSVYTTRNPDGWDTNDQAPGIGQGANGLGSHERLGDHPDENDNEADPVAAGNDQTPYVGRTHGQFGRNPGSDNTPGDSDTIEEYFIFRIDPNLSACTPNAVAVNDLGAGSAAASGPALAVAGAVTLALLAAAGYAWRRRSTHPS
ncbi:MAG: hypothetical protein NZ528_16890 [Caldilineales bacterium]|nr:hypothetical protein [Caldilineales bacterium]MDW8319020.1 hypothetical protein [Anaerolineae bacterium]